MTTGEDRDLLFQATINNGSLSIPRLVNMFFEFSLSSELGGAPGSQPRDDEKSISKFFSDCRIEFLNGYHCTVVSLLFEPVVCA